MTPQSPHRRYKGCCLMCARWVRGDGMARRLPVRDLRRLGVRRRLSRQLTPTEEP